MPFHFDEVRVDPEVFQFRSVLIVPCRFCPAASSAVRSNEPYIDLFRNSLKTASYERAIQSMRESLEERGVSTGVFKSRWLHQFVLCMWTARRRIRLLEHARRYEAVVVVGCEAAVQTVRNALETCRCEIISCLDSKGIMSIQPRFSLPSTISLQLEGLTPYVHARQVSDG